MENTAEKKDLLSYNYDDQLRICEYWFNPEDGPVQTFKGKCFNIYRLEDNETNIAWSPQTRSAVALTTDSHGAFHGHTPINYLQARTYWPSKEGETLHLVLDFQSSHGAELPYHGARSAADFKLSAWSGDTQGPLRPTCQSQNERARTGNSALPYPPPYAVYWYVHSKRSIYMLVVIGTMTDELEKAVCEKYDIYIDEKDHRIEDHRSKENSPANVKYFNQNRKNKIHMQW